MRAFVIDQPGEYSIKEDITKPVPQNGELLLEIHKVGFCGSDLTTYCGLNPIVSYPRIPGHEIAAKIFDAGPNVPENYNKGDKVLALPYTTCGNCWSCVSNRPNACKNNQTLGVQQDGGMKEYLTISHEKAITGINDLSLNDIALVEPLAVGFHAAKRGTPKEGDNMLIFGCGLVGLGAIIGGAAMGANVTAVDIDEQKLISARQFGAKYTINSSTQNLEEEVRKLTDGHGPAIVVEAIGLDATFVAAVDLVAFTGCVVYVGYVKNPVQYVTKIFVMKEIQIMGSRNAVKQDFDDVLKVMRSSNMPFEQLITKEVPLTEAGSALEHWKNNKGKVSKILVSFD